MIYQNYFAGEWQAAASGRTYPVYNPATGDKIAEVPDCGVEETRSAIIAANEAFKTWSKTAAQERFRLLQRIYEMILERQDHLAEIISLENGKPLAEAKGEIVYGVNYFLWYAEEAKRIYGETIPALVQNKRITVIKQPIGVVAAITPWNYPLAMITRKVSAALAAGCTLVVKPAEDTPLTAIELFKIFEEAGLPKGVANIVTGQPAVIGGEMLGNPLVRKITFTGSTHTGRLLMKGAAEHIKKISLELGGHAPFIVFEDADIDAAVEGALSAKFKNNGQACVCGNRFLIHRSVMEEFTAKFVEKTKQFKVGLGSESGVEIGPLINRKGLEKVESHVSDALAKGATAVTGGSRLLGGVYDGGYFYAPTILKDVTKEMKIFYEETFGPVAPLIPFDTEEEALLMANDTEYGLAAYFYTNDAGRVIRVSEGLEYGMVGVNDPGPTVAYQAPFGGIKQSGLGREGGRQGLAEYLEEKYISHQFKLDK
jgi:succinate-semialdehyde dehydrogenase/glutarate-semialdehyde dehydrogenase